MAELFHCPVCGQGYANSLAARECAEKNGYPADPKFKIKQEVSLKSQPKDAIPWTIIKMAYSQPGWLSRKLTPHKLVYLLAISPKNEPKILTTATEDEIEDKIPAINP